MRVPRQYESLVAARSLPEGPLHLAIGMFDGVHLGHRAVIDTAVQSARRAGGLAGALTFHPHPSRVLRPRDPVRLIQTPEMKAERLAQCELDVVITEPFSPELAQLEAEAFLPHLRTRLPRLSGIYVGENWRFGRGRRGDVSLLVQAGREQGVSVVSAPRINFNGEPISSTRIRGHLEAGEVALANSLLGYSYESGGVVVGGKRLGRMLGFPTLNLPWNPECRPRYGVYAVRVRRREGGEPLPAIANYGLRPTTETAEVPRLEVHVLGPCPFGEGDALVVEWLEFRRPEQRFESVDELRQQIARDIAGVRHTFEL